MSGCGNVLETMYEEKTYDTLYSQAGAWRQNTEKNILIVTNKFWVPNLYFLWA